MSQFDTAMAKVISDARGAKVENLDYDSRALAPYSETLDIENSPGKRALAAATEGFGATVEGVVALDSLHSSFTTTVVSGARGPNARGVMTTHVPSEFRPAVQRASDQANARAGQALSRADAVALECETQLQKMVQDAISTPTYTASAAEIRGHVRQADGAAKSIYVQGLIADAKASGDLRAVHSVLGEPAAASGLSRQQWTILRAHAAEVLAPVAFKQLNSVIELRGKLRKGSESIAFKHQRNSRAATLDPQQVSRDALLASINSRK